MPDRTPDHHDEPDEPISLGDVPSGLFTAWRRTIGAVASWPSRLSRFAASALRAWLSHWSDALVYHRQAAEAWTSAGTDQRRAAAALGLRAFIFGMIALAIVTASTGTGWGPGLVAAASEVLWAAMRFIIMALVMPRGVIGRARLSSAFLAGLLPYALGVTWLLRLGALGASAMLTHRGLVGAGVPRRDARLAIGWSFGGQAAVLAGGWLIRAIIALVAMR